MARMGPKPGTVRKLPPHDIITEGGAVGVLLSNRPARVWVDQADFDRIVQAHGNRSWAWVETGRYVKLKVDQKVSVPVARLVVGNSDRFIRYADGDRHNLRRENLSTEKPVQPGKGKERVKPSGKLRPSKLARPLASKLGTHPPAAKRASQFVTPLAAEMSTAPAPSPPVPASALFVKRSPPVVGTVKRHTVP